MARKKAPKIDRSVRRDELADILDVHQESVGRYDRMGAPFELRGRTHYYNEAEYRAWMDANKITGDEGRPHQADSPDLEKARLRKENALASKYELQVKRERAEVLPVDEVKQWIATHVGGARNKFMGLGARVTPLLEGRDGGERQGIIDDAVVEILNELAAA
jgi:phage terminase Nu1 subunit (DNA packaging protein)